jgi:serine/threonine protein kinase
MFQPISKPTGRQAPDAEPATLRLDIRPVKPRDPMAPPYRPGDVVAGKYRVEEVLGCGGMAWVLRATHLHLNVTVALKFLRFQATRETVARFFQEGRATAGMSSESVTRVLDVDRLPDGSPFLVMEYLDGFDLQKLVDEPGWLPVTTAVDFAIQACEGLSALHGAGIVHRDLKPANLFLTRKRSGSLRMKLIDFGISKVTSRALDHEALDTNPDALMGSPVYMAPEQMLSTKNVDGRADLWSLGVILYELLSGGRSPFEASTLPEVCVRVMHEAPAALSLIRADLPLGLETVVLRCLEKDPSRRFSDASRLAIALAPYASHRGQLRARRLQHPRSAERPDGPFPGMNVAALNVRPSLPPANPPAMRAPPMRAPPLRAPGRVLHFGGPRPEVPALPAGTGASVSRVRDPSQPESQATQPAIPQGANRPFEMRLAWASMALWVLAAVLEVIALRGPARMPPAASIEARRVAGIANHMPEATPAVLASTHVVGIEAPPSSEHVYTPEELPIASPPSAAQSTKPPRLGADVHVEGRRTADEVGF